MSETKNDNQYKLIVTIVIKGMGTRVVEASKRAGARGGTILLGRGTAPPSVYQNILGITFNPEKEIILTLADEDAMDEILEAISDEAKLNEPGKGVAFVASVREVTGIVELLKQLSCQMHMEEFFMSVSCCPFNFELIVTIVNRGFAEEVVTASKAAGAEGGTIIRGRGTGVHEKAKLFGIAIEPEKDIILTLIDKNKTERVLAAVIKAINLNEPGKGVAFVLNVEKTIGICHLME